MRRWHIRTAVFAGLAGPVIGLAALCAAPAAAEPPTPYIVAMAQHFV